MIPAANQFLWDFVWQSTIVLSFGLAASLVLRNRPAYAHVALLLGAGACLVAPLATRVVRQFDAGILPANASLSNAVAPAWDDAIDVEKAGDAIPMSADAHATPETGQSMNAPAPRLWSIILAAWLATSILACGNLVIAFVAGTRMLRRSRPVADPQLQRKIDWAASRLNIGSYAVAYESPDIRAPLVWGWRLHPALLIPSGRRTPEFESVVVHELAHVRRCDHWVLLVTQFLRVLCPWHPLLWITAKRLNDLAEEACDDFVVASGCRAPAYAEVLVEYTNEPYAPAPLIPGARPTRSSLGARVRRVLAPRCDRRTPTLAWCGVAMIAMLAVASALAFAQRSSAAADDKALASARTTIPDPPTSEDVADVSSTVQYARADQEMGYYLIEQGDASRPRPLVLVLSGGDGSPDFHTFIKRVTKSSFGKDVLVAHLIAPKWDPGQFSQMVWPTKDNPWPGMKYSTEEYAREVIRHVSSIRKVDSNQRFVFAWSSGGPAAYVMLLDEACALKGGIVAMSIYRAEQLSALDRVRGKRVAILHSPEDQMAPIRFARMAEQDLSHHGAQVRMMEYPGGHGWRSPAYASIHEAYQFVRGNNDEAPVGK